MQKGGDGAIQYLPPIAEIWTRKLIEMHLPFYNSEPHISSASTMLRAMTNKSARKSKCILNIFVQLREREIVVYVGYCWIGLSRTRAHNKI